MNSRSTPLSQLPNVTSSPSFVNDQQKHIVTAAQQATQSFALPQNTQSSSDVTMDDDATIQEVLSELSMPLNAGAADTEQHDVPPSQHQQQMHPHPHQQQPQVMMHSPHPHSHQQQPQVMMHSPHPHQMYQPVMYEPVIEPMAPPEPPSKEHAGGHATAASADSVVSTILKYILGDIKLIAVIAVSFVIIQLVPVARILSRYFITLPHIPYALLLVRSVLGSVLAYIGLKCLSRHG